MALELKSNVRKNAGRTLITSGVAYICSYECTYRATCASFVCRNCKGEVVWRPRRKEAANPVSADA